MNLKFKKKKKKNKIIIKQKKWLKQIYKFIINII